MATILAMDQEMAICSLYKHIFWIAGYEILTTRGVDGSELFWKYRPDLLLVTVDYYDISGLEIICKVREKLPQQKIIAVSAISGLRSLALEAGADDVLHKPFGIEVLLQKVKSCVG